MIELVKKDMPHVSVSSTKEFMLDMFHYSWLVGPCLGCTPISFVVSSEILYILSKVGKKLNC